MKTFLRYLAILLAAVLVFAAAKYLDSRPGKHAENIPVSDPVEVTQMTEVEHTEQIVQTNPAAEETTQPVPVRMTLTFAGDCTLGCHAEHNSAGYGFLMTVGEQYDYPFRNVKKWFENDDFTMVNLEGVLGDQGVPSGRRYIFRGYGSYVNMLTQNSIEAVSLANNHTMDYGEAGYAETKRLLDEAGVHYAENKNSTIVTLENGVTLGIYGSVYNSIDAEAMVAGIKDLKEQGVDVIIYAPHWGTEHSFRATRQQIDLGHAAIDAGADIVYGCHPHVLQPIEEYKDGVIYYSLGNFSFGGNIYPADYDTAIIQQEIVLETDGSVTLGERTIIPCSISSMEKRNNYQPTPYAEGSEEYDRVLSKLDGTYKGSNLAIH